MHTLTLKEGTVYPAHNADELLTLARTFWPALVTEFGTAVIDGQTIHRTLIWETPAAKAADQDGENVRAVIT
jgi:hypothetical protein